MEDPKVSIRTVYSPFYRHIDVSAFNIQLSEKGIELPIYVDEEDYHRRSEARRDTLYLQRTFEARLIVNPFQAKKLLQVLGSHVEQYEKIYGPIRTDKEIEAAIKALQPEVIAAPAANREQQYA